MRKISRKNKGYRSGKNGESQKWLNRYKLQRKYLEVSTIEYLEHTYPGVENCRILDDGGG